MGKSRWTALVVVLLLAMLVFWQSCAPSNDSATTPQIESSTDEGPAEPAHPTRRRPERSKSTQPAAETTPEVPPSSSAQTGVVTGRVLLADGKPAAGARIVADPQDEKLRHKSVHADEEGEFRFDALTPGSWSVYGVHGGFGTRMDQGDEPATADVTAGGEVRVEVRVRQLAVLTGRLTDAAGDPVPNAKLTLMVDAYWSPDGGAYDLETKSDAQGRYTFQNVTPGGYSQFSVKADGHAFMQVDPPEARAGVTATLDLTLERAATVTFQFLDDTTGKPVTKIYVWISDAEEGSLYHSADADHFEPDDAGRVVADSLRARMIAVQIDAEGYVTPDPLRLDPASAPAVVVVRLTPGLTISGRLLSAEGKPVADQTVTAKRNLHEFFPGMLCARTDAEGTWKISRLEAGTWIVGVFDHRAQPVVVKEVEAGASDVQLQLPKGGPRSVKVRAVDGEGRPVPLVKAYEMQLDEGYLTSGSGGRDRDHAIEVDLASDTQTYVAFWDARTAAGVKLPLGFILAPVPYDSPDEVTITLPPERTIVGRVIGPAGSTIEGARVQVATRPGKGFDASVSQFLGTVRTSADGTFRVRGLGADDVWLLPSAPTFIADPVAASPGATNVELRLLTGTSCTIRVLDEDSKPVSGIVVQVWPRTSAEIEFEEDWTEHETAADGRVTLHGLRADTAYRLTVNADDDRQQLLEWTNEEWKPADTEVVLERAFQLSGKVRFADDKQRKEALAAHFVSVSASRNGEPKGHAHITPDGTFTFKRLPRGHYVLELHLGNVSGSVEADAGDTDVEIVAR